MPPAHPYPRPACPPSRAGVRTPEGRTGLLDDVYGVGFHLLLDGTVVCEDPSAVAWTHVLTVLDASVIRLVPTGDSTGAEDLDDVLIPYLRQCGHAIQIVRPDGYVFGGVADTADLPSLLAELARAVHVSSEVPARITG
jgi:hypothetical protein